MKLLSRSNKQLIILVIPYKRVVIESSGAASTVGTKIAIFLKFISTKLAEFLKPHPSLKW